MRDQTGITSSLFDDVYRSNHVIAVAKIKIDPINFRIKAHSLNMLSIKLRGHKGVNVCLINRMFCMPVSE